jgi:hypothetical protein
VSIMMCVVWLSDMASLHSMLHNWLGLGICSYLGLYNKIRLSYKLPRLYRIDPSLMLARLAGSFNKRNCSLGNCVGIHNNSNGLSYDNSLCKGLLGKML